MRKLKIFITLALASICATGCDALDSIIDMFNGKDTPQIPDDKKDSEEDQGHEDEGHDDEGGGEDVTNYTVTFNANGGSGTMQAKETSGSSYLVPACSFTYEGYKFDGWALNSADGAKYAVASTITGINSNIVLYATWKVKGSSSEIDDDYGDYYSSVTDDLIGTELKQKLNSINKSNKKKSFSYGDIKWTSEYTEKDWTGKANVEGKMFGFYDNALVNEKWDNTNTWNREHVWPDSMGGSKVEGDCHMTRPTSVKINSDRHNWYYAESGNEAYDPGEFDANYRGVAARIVFYCAIADTSLDIIDQVERVSNCMGKLSDMLKWNLQYEPDRSEDAPLALRIEQNRNKEIYSNEKLQGNRNPFIDHPEYACKIWGNTNQATKAICGGN